MNSAVLGHRFLEQGTRTGMALLQGERWSSVKKAAIQLRVAITVKIWAGSLVNLGKNPQAAQYFDQSLKICIDLENLQGLGYNFEDVGRLAIALGDYRGAIRKFQQALTYIVSSRLV